MFKALDRQSCRRRAVELGPYLLLELLMPGGTIAAALLWLARKKRIRPKEESS